MAGSVPNDTIMPTSIPAITAGIYASNADGLWFGGTWDGNAIDEVLVGS
jgi:hypothetical protein